MCKCVLYYCQRVSTQLQLTKYEYNKTELSGSFNIITYSMVQSSSWEANWFAASQEIPRISRNPKVHYRTHQRPPTVSILGQLNPVHIPTSHFLEIHPNIIHPYTPRSHQWSSLRFPQQVPIQPPLLTHTRHMPKPSTLSVITLPKLSKFTCLHESPNFVLQNEATLKCKWGPVSTVGIAVMIC